ncbi:MAG TPA: ATP-binding protein [Candidatus Acidoferrum sp.]|nr:ATP-binding protein [Candidatus Acidoferrum sp.]
MQLRMELQSDPEMLCVVRAALAQLAEKLGFPDSECRAVVLAVDEALTNIIRHAYGGKTGLPITASFRCVEAGQHEAHKEAFEIVLEDQGVTVDRAKLCGRALEDVRPGGLGLHFIRESMDEMEFSRSNDRNQLRLVKFLRTPEPAKGS